MKRINLFELLVFVLFSEHSAGMPSMFSGCGSSSSMPEQLDSYYYELEFFTRGHWTDPVRLYLNSFIYVVLYDDPCAFEYRLTATSNVTVFENKGRNTDIVFLIGHRLKIRAKDDANISYNIDFKISSQASDVATYMMSSSTDSARYQKCQGSNSYKLEGLYRHYNAHTLIELGENWCIFKTRKDNVTTFIIRWISPIEEHRKVESIFRSTEKSVTPLPDTNNRLNLSFSLGEQLILDPKYVLETSTPDQLQEFFDSP